MEKTKNVLEIIKALDNRERKPDYDALAADAQNLFFGDKLSDEEFDALGRLIYELEYLREYHVRTLGPEMAKQLHARC